MVVSTLAAFLAGRSSISGKKLPTGRADVCVHFCACFFLSRDLCCVKCMLHATTKWLDMHFAGDIASHGKCGTLLVMNVCSVDSVQSIHFDNILNRSTIGDMFSIS